jgi:aminopeptidase N
MASRFTEQAGVPLVVAEVTCTGEEQRARLRQDQFQLRHRARTGPAPQSSLAKPPPLAGKGREGADAEATTRRWQLPVAVGPLRALRTPETIVLDGEATIAAGRCGDPVKLNLGDIGYYRVEYDAMNRAALAGSMAMMAPADRVNLLADSWALVEAARADARSYFELVELISPGDVRAVWEQIVGTLGRLDRLARGREEQPALRAFARAKLRPVFARLGWDEGDAEDDDGALLRVRLIRMLGELGDNDIVAQAQWRFAEFLRDPAALRPGLREAVAHVAGLNADRATYEQLIALARKATDTSERVRYYSAAAGARDPALARTTLELTLGNELPSTLVGILINTVAGAGEQPELAWAFVRENLQSLASRQGPSFRNNFVSNFMTVFSDPTHAAELAQFAPVQATSGGRMVAARSVEAIVLASELKAHALPAIGAWLRHRSSRD